MNKKPYWLRLLVSIDQFFNVLLWNGNEDQTISGHIGYKIEDGTATWFDKLIAKGLHKIDHDHVSKNIEKDEIKY